MHDVLDGKVHAEHSEEQGKQIENSRANPWMQPVQLRLFGAVHVVQFEVHVKHCPEASISGAVQAVQFVDSPPLQVLQAASHGRHDFAGER